MKTCAKPPQKCGAASKKCSAGSGLGTLLSISIPCFFGYCPRFLGVLQSRLMEAISTLKVGDAAPEFSLAAANGDQVVSLNAVLRSGPTIVEFLRGTW